MSKLTQIPYERLVAWLAPYIAIGAGALSTWLCTRISLFSALGVSQTTLEHGIAVGVTGGLTTLAAYAAQHKWLDNLAKYWVNPTPVPPLSGAPRTQVEPGPVEPAPAAVPAPAQPAQTESSFPTKPAA